MHWTRGDCRSRVAGVFFDGNLTKVVHELRCMRCQATLAASPPQPPNARWVPPAEFWAAPWPSAEQRSILAEAGDVVHGDRRKDYGSPLENHDRTAKLWSGYLGVPVTAEDVCMLNILQKVSRAKHALKRDNLVDIAGYAANVELIENERKKT
jgi:hypothetical protein